MRKLLNIEIFNSIPQEKYGGTIFWSKFYIGDYEEEFFSYLDFWLMEDYLNQWEDGVRRIHFYDNSCLVSSVSSDKFGLSAYMWLLYRENDQILIEPQYFRAKRMKKLKKIPFTPETCYKFMPQKRMMRKNKDEMMAPLWTIDFEALDIVQS